MLKIAEPKNVMRGQLPLVPSPHSARRSRQAAVEHAAAYSKTRVQFGRPISTLQAIQTLLSETATDCHLARLGVLDAAQLLDNGESFQVEAAMVRQFLVRLHSGVPGEFCTSANYQRCWYERSLEWREERSTRRSRS